MPGLVYTYVQDSNRTSCTEDILCVSGKYRIFQDYYFLDFALSCRFLLLQYLQVK